MFDLVDKKVTYLFDLPEVVTDIQVVFPEGENGMGGDDEMDGADGDSDQMGDKDSMGDNDGMEGNDDKGSKDGMEGDDDMGGKDRMKGDDDMGGKDGMEGDDDMDGKDRMKGDDDMGDKDGMKGDDNMGDKDKTDDDDDDMDKTDGMDEKGDIGGTGGENDEDSSPMYVYVVSEGKVFKINRDNPADKTEVVLSRGTRPKFSTDGKILYYIRGLNTLVRRDPADPNSVRVVFASPRIGEYVISSDDRKIFYVEEMTRSLNVFNTENNRRRVLINNFVVPDTLSFDDDSK